MDDLADEYYDQQDYDQQDYDQEDETEETEEYKEYAEYAIDENGNVLDYLVYGADACVIWATIALNIARERFEIFSDDYGNEVESLVGLSTDHDFVASEAKRMITECLTVNEHINGITNFEIEFENDKAYVNFTLDTEYGEADMNVSV